MISKTKVECKLCDGSGILSRGDECCDCDGFAGLWENINGRGSWYENPWVVAYTFEKPEQVADE